MKCDAHKGPGRAPKDCAECRVLAPVVRIPDPEEVDGENFGQTKDGTYVSLDIKTEADSAKRRRKKDDFGDKVKAHQRYYTADGEMVPGSTTVLGVIAKPYLVKWANKLGLEGIDTDKYKDEAAAIGSLAHYLVECDLKGVEPELDDYTPAQLKRARFSFATYKEWRAKEAQDVQVLGVETRLVSEEYRYGGTADLYAIINGRHAGVDFKTSPSIYLEHKAQLASYGRVIRVEQDKPLVDLIVVRLGRTEGDTYEAHTLAPKHVRLYWRLFLAAKTLYDLQKEIKREGG